MRCPAFVRCTWLCVFSLCWAASLPARSLPARPSDADKERWKAQGRDLPEPEFLQPTLDPALPPFTPRYGTSLTAHIHGAASDVLADLTLRWIEAFREYYPHVTVDVPPPYAGSLGALELIKGKVDFVAVSRELKPSDVAAFEGRFGHTPFSEPIAGGTWRHFGFLDSVAFFVNEDNPLKQLSFKQLDSLLSTTRLRGGEPVRTWGQLGLTGEWADKPIHVWAVQPWNGFEEFVRQRVLSVDGQRGEWRTDLNFVDTVFPVSPHVAADRYAIGYAGMAYVGDGVKLLALAEGEGGVALPPDYEDVARATYPLSRLVYVNLNQTPGKPLDPALEEFIRFIVSREGQQVVLKQGIFLPLRAGQAAGTRARLEVR